MTFWFAGSVSNTVLLFESAFCTANYINGVGQTSS